MICSRILAAVVLSVCCGLSGTVAWGAATPDDDMITPEREAAALTFAKRNHPELARLLERTRQRDSKEFSEAIVDLFRTSERIARTKARDPERAELDLDAWKIDSRIRLLTARLAVRSSPSLESELAELVEQRINLRAALLKHERGRIVARLDRVDEEIARHAAQRDEMAEAEVVRLLKLVERQRRAVEPTGSSPTPPKPASQDRPPATESTKSSKNK